jgi:hypothetical protein
MLAPGLYLRFLTGLEVNKDSTLVTGVDLFYS